MGNHRACGRQTPVRTPAPASCGLARQQFVLPVVLCERPVRPGTALTWHRIRAAEPPSPCSRGLLSSGRGGARLAGAVLSRPHRPLLITAFSPGVALNCGAVPWGIFLGMNDEFLSFILPVTFLPPVFKDEHHPLPSIPCSSRRQPV